ncbi:MAG: SBBP repeat-containing protein [Acidobacteriota bacterium]
MKASFTRSLFGFAFIASWIATQASPPLVWLNRNAQQFSEAASAVHTGVLHNMALDGEVSKGRRIEQYQNLPLSFEPYNSQADPEVKFSARCPGYYLYLCANQAVMKLDLTKGPPLHRGQHDSQNANPESAIVRMKLVGANPNARIVALDELPGKSNYFIGNDPKKWRINVSTYARIKCQSVYPGVDMVYYGSQRQLEYDFQLAAGANPEAIRLSFDGAEGIQIDATGGFLKIATPAGEFIQHKPVVYQQVEGARTEIACTYVMKSNQEVGFEIAEYDMSKPLIIDPVLSYSTYLGGSSSEGTSGIAVDAAGNAYVTGSTSSADFPNTNGSFQWALARSDAFVTKINSSGTAIVYSTYLGGSDTENLGRGEQGLAIAVDQAGNAYVTGETSSVDFPTTPGALRSTPFSDRFVHGNIDAFVTKLNATGSALTYSTYLGGLYPGFEAPVASTDIGLAITVDSEGSAYVAGETNSTDFPVANALQPTRLATSDAFISKLNPTGTALIYSTYLGGDSTATGIAVDAAGHAYVVGTTSSTNFPVTANAFQSSLNGSADGFVVKVDAAGTSLLYSTYLGGRSTDDTAGIAIDMAGNAYVTGHTRSTDFPTANPLQPLNASGPVFKSTDGGTSWTSLSAGLSTSAIDTIIVDPKSPSNVYVVASGEGIFKSTNGGTSWSSANAGLPTDVRTLAIDPVTPTTLYAGLSVNGVYKSTNGGANWSSTGLSGSTANPKNIAALAIDPSNTAIIFAGAGLTGIAQFPPSDNNPTQELPSLLLTGLYKSTDGGSTWRASDTGLPPGPTLAIAIDPKMPGTIYAGFRGVFKSEDAGNNWARVLDLSPIDITVLAIDPQDTSNIYAGSFFGLFKSRNAGRIWRDTREPPLNSAFIQAIAIDPRNPSIIYAAAQPGLFKSTDGGETWSETGLAGGRNIFGLAIDPVNTSTLYATSTTSTNAFVAKLNSTGTGLVYSTYLGGRNGDRGTSIAVDAGGNATLTGITFSEDFPVKNALQSKISRGPSIVDAFITRLTPTGALSYSTFFGGKGTDGGEGVALDAHGNAYVAGFTTSGNLPTKIPLQAEYGGQGDGFILKISLPRITTVAISGKRLIVAGEGFADGAVILVNGAPQKTNNDETSSTSMLVARKAGKSIAPGQSVVIRVRNPDGTLSNEFNFVRPV